MESLEVGKPFDSQAVFVFFALAVPSIEEFEKTLAGTLCLGTVCKGAIYAQRTLDGK